jgi:hemerythrin
MVIHYQAIKELTPADYLAIEKEHAQLEKFLEDLRDACACSNLNQLPDCQSCNHEIMTSCQGRIASFLFCVINITGKHFQHEEAIMLSRPHVTVEYEYYRLHRESHYDLMQKLHALTDECFSLRNKSKPPEIYHKFYESLSDLFKEHNRSFDDPFLQSTKT